MKLYHSFLVTRRMTINIYRQGQTRNVTRLHFYKNIEAGCVAPVAHRSYAEFVNVPENILFQLRDLGIGIPGPYFPEQGLFCKQGGAFKSSADSRSEER